MLLVFSDPKHGYGFARLVRALEAWLRSYPLGRARESRELPNEAGQVEKAVLLVETFYGWA